MIIIFTAKSTKKFQKIKENVGMNWWKKYGGKVGMGCVQKQALFVSNIHKPHLHKGLHVVYNSSLSQSECIRNAKLKHCFLP